MDLKQVLSDFARINDRLLRLAIETEKTNKFKSSEKSCSIMYPEAPIISMSVNSEPINPPNQDLHTFGLSFSVDSVKYPKWVFEGEVGWSSYKYGFEDVHMVEYSYDSIEDLLIEIDSVIEELINIHDKYIKNKI